VVIFLCYWQFEAFCFMICYSPISSYREYQIVFYVTFVIGLQQYSSWCGCTSY